MNVFSWLSVISQQNQGKGKPKKCTEQNRVKGENVRKL